MEIYQKTIDKQHGVFVKAFTFKNLRASDTPRITGRFKAEGRDGLLYLVWKGGHFELINKQL